MNFERYEQRHKKPLNFNVMINIFSYMQLRSVFLLHFSYFSFSNFLLDFEFKKSISFLQLQDYCIENCIDFDLLLFHLNKKNYVYF